MLSKEFVEKKANLIKAKEEFARVLAAHKGYFVRSTIFANNKVAVITGFSVVDNVEIERYDMLRIFYEQDGIGGYVDI